MNTRQRRTNGSMRILIVDDDAVSLQLLSHALTRHGYEVVRAFNGREALDVLAREPVRFVITDWEMPVMNGLELCRQIRRQSQNAYTYVMLVTCHNGAEEVVEGMSAGADDFIAKPFNQSELVVRVRAGERILALDTREMVIFALAKLAESRDPETGQHLERVQRYSQLLAQRLAQQTVDGSIDERFVQLVYETSPLHDIGKVGVPDEVLLKPGPLTAEEFEVMKTHTLIGAETLDAALANYPHARFLQIARDIAIAHHERYDGDGYPYGLSGEEIPLCARIVAVADVYDALTSKRTYKEAMSHEVARDIILAGSGAHFDPALVELFVELEDQFIEISRRFSEGQAEAAEAAPVCAAT